MNEWPVVLTTLGLVLAALGGVFTLALALGRLQQTVATLVGTDAKRDHEIDKVKERLAKGEVRFAEVAMMLQGIAKEVTEVKEILRRRENDDGT